MYFISVGWMMRKAQVGEFHNTLVHSPTTRRAVKRASKIKGFSYLKGPLADASDLRIPGSIPFKPRGRLIARTIEFVTPPPILILPIYASRLDQYQVPAISSLENIKPLKVKHITNSNLTRSLVKKNIAPIVKKYME